MIDPEIRIDSEGPNEPITVEDVKSWGKYEGTHEDNIIAQVIRSCRQLQEQWTGRSFLGKTMTINWREQRDYSIDLPMGPTRSITSIKRVYEDGTLSDALVESTDYYITGMDFKTINLYKRWQSAGKIVTGLRVVQVVGHGDASGQVPLPHPIREALLRHVITDLDMRDDLEVYNSILYDWTKEALAPYRIGNLWL